MSKAIYTLRRCIEMRAHSEEVSPFALKVMRFVASSTLEEKIALKCRESFHNVVGSGKCSVLFDIDALQGAKIDTLRHKYVDSQSSMDRTKHSMETCSHTLLEVAPRKYKSFPLQPASECTIMTSQSAANMIPAGEGNQGSLPRGKGLVAMTTSGVTKLVKDPGASNEKLLLVRDSIVSSFGVHQDPDANWCFTGTPQRVAGIAPTCSASIDMDWLKWNAEVGRCMKASEVSIARRLLHPCGAYGNEGYFYGEYPWKSCSVEPSCHIAQLQQDKVSSVLRVNPVHVPGSYGTATPVIKSTAPVVLLSARSVVGSYNVQGSVQAARGRASSNADFEDIVESLKVAIRDALFAGIKNYLHASTLRNIMTVTSKFGLLVNAFEVKAYSFLQEDLSYGAFTILRSKLEPPKQIDTIPLRLDMRKPDPASSCAWQGRQSRELLAAGSGRSSTELKLMALHASEPSDLASTENRDLWPISHHIFRSSLKNLRRKGLSVEPHLFVHPLQTVARNEVTPSMTDAALPTLTSKSKGESDIASSSWKSGRIGDRSGPLGLALNLVVKSHSVPSYAYSSKPKPRRISSSRPSRRRTADRNNEDVSRSVRVGNNVQTSVNSPPSKRKIHHSLAHPAEGGHKRLRAAATHSPVLTVDNETTTTENIIKSKQCDNEWHATEDDVIICMQNAVPDPDFVHTESWLNKLRRSQQQAQNAAIARRRRTAAEARVRYAELCANGRKDVRLRDRHIQNTIARLRTTSNSRNLHVHGGNGPGAANFSNVESGSSHHHQH